MAENLTHGVEGPSLFKPRSHYKNLTGHDYTNLHGITYIYNT